MTASDFNEPSGAETSSPGSEFSADGKPGGTDGSLRVLDRLARTLGLPVAAFFEEDDATAGGDRPALEAAALNRAFLTIEDPAARRRCLDFVNEAARRDREEERPTLA